MKSMRDMIKLMEGVMAVPGVGSPGGTESDMQTAGTVGRDQAYSGFDSSQPAVDEAKREPMYHSVFYYDPATDTWGHQFDADDAEDARLEAQSLRNQGQKVLVIRVPKSQADWRVRNVDEFVKGVLAKKQGVAEKAPPGEEALVKSLKKEYPGHEEKAFATAWSIYDKKHGKGKVSEDGVDSPNSSFSAWQKDAIATLYTRMLSRSAFPDKAKQETKDSALAGGIIGSKQVPELDAYLEWFDQGETLPDGVKGNNSGIEGDEDMMLGLNHDDSPGVYEKAPPGMEKAVKDIKKEYPGHPEKAFATAWSIYDKKHGKHETDEAIELHPDQDLGTEQGWFIVAQDGMIASGPFDSLGEAQRHAHFMEWYKRNPRLYSFENGIRDEAGMFVDLEGNEMKEAQVDTCRQSNPASADIACAMEEDFDLNNGYDSEQYASGQDYFPNGADSPVVKKVGPSGARQGDNPEQKKMQVTELHKELVYGYRTYLKETASQKPKKGEKAKKGEEPKEEKKAEKGEKAKDGKKPNLKK